MRTALISLVLLMAGEAFAQDNETAWLTADQASTRFSEGDVKGVRFKANAEVVVVYKEGDRVRVKGEAGFGWVVATALTSEAPANKFDMNALMKQMEQLKDLSVQPGAGGATSLPITVGGGE